MYKSEVTFLLLAEELGTYRLHENTLISEYRLKNNQGLNVLGSHGIAYAIDGDKLKRVSGNEFSGIEYSRVSPDSFPCGLKPWVLFSKPATWTLF